MYEVAITVKDYLHVIEKNFFNQVNKSVKTVVLLNQIMMTEITSKYSKDN